MTFGAGCLSAGVAFALPLPELVAPNVDGALSNGWVHARAVSADGRYVVFATDATDMVPGDTVQRSRLFVRDLTAGSSELISIWTDGRQATAAGPSISDDGRYVVFDTSDDGFDPADNNADTDLFIRDRTAGTTQMIPRPAGVDWEGGTLSGDANRLFWSDSQPSASAVGVLDFESGESRTLNVSAVDDLPRNSYPPFSSGAVGPGVSTDGRWVLFNSNELLAGDPADLGQAYRYDWDTDELVNVCTSGLGVPTTGHCNAAALSRNGRYVLVWAAGTAFGFDAPNSCYRLYLKDMVTGLVDHVDQTNEGTLPFSCMLSTLAPAQVSDDGRIVAFGHSQWLSFRGRSVSSAAYARDMQRGVTAVLSPYPWIEVTGHDWQEAVGALSADGGTIIVNGHLHGAPHFGTLKVSPYRIPGPHVAPVDLRVTLTQRTSNPNEIEAVITNVGANRATVTDITISSASLDVAGAVGPCDFLPGSTLPIGCILAPIAAGQSSQVVIVTTETGEQDIRVQLRTSEVELTPADNDVTLDFTVPESDEGGGGGGAPGPGVLALLALCGGLRSWRGVRARRS